MMIVTQEKAAFAAQDTAPIKSIVHRVMRFILLSSHVQRQQSDTSPMTPSSAVISRTLWPATSSKSSSASSPPPHITMLSRPSSGPLPGTRVTLRLELQGLQSAVGAAADAALAAAGGTASADECNALQTRDVRIKRQMRTKTKPQKEQMMDHLQSKMLCSSSHAEAEPSWWQSFVAPSRFRCFRCLA